MFDFFKKIAQELKLEVPFELRICNTTKKGTEAEYSARYNKKGELSRHIITLYIKNNARSCDTLIVHELIHAAQEERGIEEIHGPFFKRMAKKLEKRHGLPEIYIKGVDV